MLAMPESVTSEHHLRNTNVLSNLSTMHTILGILMYRKTLQHEHH